MCMHDVSVYINAVKLQKPAFKTEKSSAMNLYIIIYIAIISIVIFVFNKAIMNYYKNEIVFF